jgi:hypothetical protein
MCEVQGLVSELTPDLSGGRSILQDQPSCQGGDAKSRQKIPKSRVILAIFELELFLVCIPICMILYCATLVSAVTVVICRIAIGSEKKFVLM